MTDLRARARKTADLIIDRLLEKAGFAVIPTVEREHAAGLIVEALVEQVEAYEARLEECGSIALEAIALAKKHIAIVDDLRAISAKWEKKG